MTAEDQAHRWASDQWQKWPVIPHITTEKRYRHTWSQALIKRGQDHGEIPLYGSREWCELADDDPRKAAAAIRAAEAWARQGDDLGYSLLLEDHDRRRADNEHWERVHAQRRQHVTDQLARMRRNENRANTTTSRDEQAGYTGGPVNWETNEGGARGLHYRDATNAA